MVLQYGGMQVRQKVKYIRGLLFDDVILGIKERKLCILIRHKYVTELLATVRMLIQREEYWM